MVQNEESSGKCYVTEIKDVLQSATSNFKFRKKRIVSKAQKVPNDCFVLLY